MPNCPAFIIDSFTRNRFAGNPAAVCFLDKELPDVELLRIAKEFNLSETAFPLPLDTEYTQTEKLLKSHKFSLRWFTPKVEVKLCGHATLAAAHALFYECGNINKRLTFTTLSGELTVSRATDANKLIMDFPKYDIYSLKRSSGKEEMNDFPQLDDPNNVCAELADALVGPANWSALAYAPEACKLIVVMDPKMSSNSFEAIQVSTNHLLDIHPDGRSVRGIIVTLAPEKAKQQGFKASNEGRQVDYVCRYFAPWVGIEEDPVTGSAQCAAAPYWAHQLDKNDLYAQQSCPGRGGELFIEVGQTVQISGSAVTVFKGSLCL